MSPEARVGIFVLIGIAVVMFFGMRTGDMEMFGKDRGTRLLAEFDSIAGLDRKAVVRIAGVRVGQVDLIELYAGKALVTIRLDEGVEIRSGAVAQVASLGILGDKYIEILPGLPGAPLLASGDTIRGTEPVSIDQIVSSINNIGDDFKAITESFRQVVATDEGRERLHSIVANLDETIAGLNQIVASNRELVNETMENIRETTGLLRGILERNQDEVDQTAMNLQELTGDLRDRLPSLIDSLDNLATGLSGVVGSNEENLQETLDNVRLASVDLRDTMDSVRTVAERIEKGEGTVGRLVNEDDTVNKLNTALDSLDTTLVEAQGFLGKFGAYQTFLGYHGDYLGETENYRNVVSIRVQPRKDKFYLLELVDSPLGKRSITTTHTETTSSVDGTEVVDSREEKYEDELTFSLQVARRIGPAVFRGGMIEYTGGVGSDLYLLEDRIRLSADLYDFGRDEMNPHLRLGAELRFMDYFTLRGGYDDVLEEDRRSYYMGAGISFADEDFKFLLGLLPLVSGA